MLEHPKADGDYQGETASDITMGNQQATREEIAWLAGIWDGEGTIAARHNTKIRQISPRVHITNTSPEIIAKAKEILRKIGVNPAMYEKGQGGFPGSHKQCWTLGVQTMSGAKIIIEALMPYLVGKKRQAEFMLEFVNSRISVKESHKRNSDNKYTEREIDCIRSVYLANGDIRGSSQTLSTATQERFKLRVDDIVGPSEKSDG